MWPQPVFNDEFVRFVINAFFIMSLGGGITGAVAGVRKFRHKKLRKCVNYQLHIPWWED